MVLFAVQTPAVKPAATRSSEAEEHSKITLPATQAVDAGVLNVLQWQCHT
jgi:hypothetical protein